MPQIYIAAVITTVVTAAVFGLLCWWRLTWRERLAMIIAVVAYIPIYWLAFYLYRMPLDYLVRQVVDVKSGLYLFITTFYAPITEEPAKWLLFLVPAFLALTKGTKLVKFAMAIGLGFGIGEMWLIAYKITSVPEFAGYPWYYFTGYMNERFIVCIVHSGFVAFMLWFLRRSWVVGAVGAMVLHYFANFPIYLKYIGFGGLSADAWNVVLSLWITGYLIGMIVMLCYFGAGANIKELGRVFYGFARCPECGKVYVRPLFLAANLINRRYERCPHCKHFHMMDAKRNADLEAEYERAKAEARERAEAVGRRHM